MTGTLTLTNYTFRDRMNDCLVRRATYAGPAAYVTGGDPIDNTDDFGWSQTHTLQGVLENPATGIILLVYLDRANQLIVLYDVAGGAELANGIDASVYSGELFVTGR